MNVKQIRQTFLDYFAKHHHQVVASSPLIPAEDPTLLFANAGMNQFKDCFLGTEKRSYQRATSSQKCVRAGGKHNDLDQVGFTARHLTFFEMLGNFSFGDYFKREAISFAWDLLTNGYKIDSEKLYATVFREDDEAYDIWNKEIGLDAARIGRLDEKDNFWAMGDTGPCGPCSEIYFDQGASLGCGSSDCAPGCECDRFIEVWNLVFMQFNRSEDGTLTPLAQTGVDTGMGFERLCTVLQGKKNVFHSDVFAHLRSTIDTLSGLSYDGASVQIQAAYNVVCDHIRSSSLIIADGCSPANDGRGYVLRKIIRRAILFAKKLSHDDAFIPKLAQAFIDDQSDVFPELGTNATLITAILTQEVQRFSHNLHSGQAIIAKYIAETKAAGMTTLSGAHAFKLYDTYGFPLELTRVIALENNIHVDEAGFEKYMAVQQEQSKAGGKTTDDDSAIPFPNDTSTSFVGYDNMECSTSILWEHTTNDYRWIITQETPFYVESGGQVNDEGVVTINHHSYHVVDLKKLIQPHSIAIAVKLKPVETMGACSVGDTAECTVSKDARINTVRNHTATHMLHAALRENLGEQAKQAGSVVNKDYLRFDYTHHEALTPEQIEALEQRVNEKIWEDISTEISNTTLEDAKSRGIIAFFGEKYNPENVRVVSIPGFSNELCGGTHASSTGIIGCFKIVSDIALATGTRRIVAVTGQRALELFQQSYRDIKKIAERFKAKPEEAVAAVTKQADTLSETQKELKKAHLELVTLRSQELVTQVSETNGVSHLVTCVEGADGNALRTIAQRLQQTTPGFYFIASNSNGKSQFICSVDASLQGRIEHAALRTFLQEQGLRGGGKPGTIQGGGPVLDGSALAHITAWATQV